MGSETTAIAFVIVSDNHCLSVRMNWKVSGQSKKCPDNLENESGYLEMSLDDLEVCLDNLESFRMILKVSG